jgi:hypothetical protein
MKQESAIILLFDSCRGVYIPRDFVSDERLRENFGLTDENKTSWMPCLDPNSDYYWGAWDWVLDNAEHNSELGNYRLHQDGDLWGLDYDRMTNEEKENFGFEDYECVCDSDSEDEGEN